MWGAQNSFHFLFYFHNYFLNWEEEKEKQLFKKKKKVLFHFKVGIKIWWEGGDNWPNVGLSVISKKDIYQLICNKSLRMEKKNAYVLPLFFFFKVEKMNVKKNETLKKL